jgi:genome maintenance exonuclease 1
MNTNLARYEPSRVSLNNRRHYTCNQFPNVPEGMLLPSVTTVLSSMAPVSKIMALINWRKRVGNDEANRRTRLAADRGTWMHGVIEDLFNGEDIENHLVRKPEWKPYFDAIDPFLELIDKPLLAESAVAWWGGNDDDESDENDKEEDWIGYAGTLDQLAFMADGAIALMDWKTSYKMKPDYQLADYKKQLGAYSLAAEQMYAIDIDQAYCVISVYDPEAPDREAELQILQMDGFELVQQQMVMRDTVKRYFNQFYPGGKALALTMDRG